MYSGPDVLIECAFSSQFKKVWVLICGCLHRLSDLILMPCPKAELPDLDRGTAGATLPTEDTRPLHRCKYLRAHSPSHMGTHMHRVGSLGSCTVPLAHVAMFLEEDGCEV